MPYLPVFAPGLEFIQSRGMLGRREVGRRVARKLMKFRRRFTVLFDGRLTVIGDLER